MKRILSVALFLLPLTEAYAQPPAGASDIQWGKEIWRGYFGLQNDCKLCHGENGEGGFAASLAGHQLTDAEFLAAVREGRGFSMPAFVADKNLNDKHVTQVAAYLRSLPKYTGPPALWRTPVPPIATPRQTLNVLYGCGQCHGPVMANPRRTAGGLGADYEWFKRAVYDHTRNPETANRTHLRMGNYSRRQVPEHVLQELWQFFANELGFRVPISASVSAGVPSANGVTYTVTVQNTGTPGKGLTAEYVTVALPLLRGRDPEEVTSIVVATTGEGYTGMHRDVFTNSSAAEFLIPSLGPGERRTLTITLKGPGSDKGIPRGTVKWEKPRLNTGSSEILSITVPLGQ